MNSQLKGLETRNKAYSLTDFLSDCEHHPEKIMIDRGNALEKAKNSPLRLVGKSQILEFLTQYDESDFEYVNTKEYRNGIHGKHPPVDSYKLNITSWKLYISFCVIRTANNGWFIKSFHPDDGDTMSIGNIIANLENSK